MSLADSPDVVLMAGGLFLCGLLFGLFACIAHRVPIGNGACGPSSGRKKTPPIGGVAIFATLS
jgi:UDP-N-acetylmuramyl pentapeptide phosphotransferase/UDP-N-acetylglucosamine-1-phosphate transferase